MALADFTAKLPTKNLFQTTIASVDGNNVFTLGSVDGLPTITGYNLLIYSGLYAGPLDEGSSYEIVSVSAINATDSKKLTFTREVESSPGIDIQAGDNVQFIATVGWLRGFVDETENRLSTLDTTTSALASSRGILIASSDIDESTTAITDKFADAGVFWTVETPALDIGVQVYAQAFTSGDYESASFHTLSFPRLPLDDSFIGYWVIIEIDGTEVEDHLVIGTASHQDSINISSDMVGDEHTLTLSFDFVKVATDSDVTLGLWVSSLQGSALTTSANTVIKIYEATV